jgi:hypothetical protein
MRRTTSIGRFVAALPLTWAACVPCSQAASAEYAVRWSPSSGGPRDVGGVMKALGLEGGEVSKFRIQYHDVRLPAGAPSGAAAIARERERASKVETTWKYRGASPFDAGTEHTWMCPLLGKAQRKDEVDVSMLAGGETRRAYSRSCTVKGAYSGSLPSALQGAQVGCSSRMERQESADGRYKVERWRLSNGQRLLEVSWSAGDTDVDLADFRRRVVEPLVSAGVQPLDRSKTELGTQCQRP